MKKFDFHTTGLTGSAHRSLRRILALGITISMLGSIGLTSACSKSLEVSDESVGQTEIVLYNWGEYIAEDTIAKFEAAYPQYKVVSRVFETNEIMYPNLSNSYDVIIPSDYMVCRLIRENKLQKLDMGLLPNVAKNMDPLFKDVTYDLDKTVSDSLLSYSVPYLYCTVGLVYDANKVTLDPASTDPGTVWGVLFDGQYKNKVGMYD